MTDTLVVGAGPAGSVAATVLARAGVRVRIVDRASFPREKLCGDTVNPGTLARLRELKLSQSFEQHALRVPGMRVTGQNGLAIEGVYPHGLYGLAISRAELDWALLQQAMAAGAEFEPGVVVRRAHAVTRSSGSAVDGVVVAGVAGVAGSAGTGARGGERAIHADVVIAADGRRSAVAFGLGLARHPARPRRWAIGAYFEGDCGTSALGEMHIRRGRYIGVARVAGVTNVCLVQPAGPDEPSFRDPSALLRRELERDGQLRDRFASARLVRPPVVLGPLAVESDDCSIDGLLLAGDAAGFVDPMTGDGLRFAVRGGELAAAAALDALEHGWSGVHARLAAARRRDFGAKWRFNRALRALVSSPAAVDTAAFGARFAPQVVRAIVARAGDCG